MLSRVSGRAARGSGYTIPGLCLPASLASLMGSVIKCLAGDPEKGLVGGCWRAGEKRPNPEKLSLTVGSRILSGVNLGRFIYPRISGWSRQNGRSLF